MTLTVNGQPAEPGCYVEGHWGQYGPDHFADQLEGFGIVIPKGIDPRRYRRIAEWVDNRSDDPIHGPLANVYLACMETDYEVENLANEFTEGGYWEWYDGECFLRSYVCPECGRDATCNTCGGTGVWESTTEEEPTTLISLGQCPDCTTKEGAEPCDYCCDADDPGCFA